MHDLKRIADLLGGEIAGNNTVLAPGPGHSHRDRSLAVRLDPSAPDGFLTFSHAGDDWKACRDYVRSRLGLPAWEPGDGQNRTIPAEKVAQWDLAAVDAEAETTRPRTEDDLVRIARAVRIWREAADPRGTLAEVYLREHRALDVPASLCGSVLRFHPECPRRNENTGKTERLPALVAAFRSIDDDEITGVHRIFLSSDGQKIDRRMLGIIHRAAVKLSPESDTLSIGEGIETCMAAQELGFAPAWALGSVGAISFFPVLENVRCLRILGEAGNVSDRAATMSGTRWKRAGRRVQVVKPSAGSDLNDELMDRRRTA
jgi:hypothetical protein